MEEYIKRRLARKQRHKTILTKIRRVSRGKPRLCVHRSLKHINAQIVDDIGGKSLVQITSCQIKDKMKKTEKSKVVGKLLAEKALKLGIKEVVFDRGGYLYHGRIKALADGARDGGLKF